jgi:hypothetical protein
MLVVCACAFVVIDNIKYPLCHTTGVTPVTCDEVTHSSIVSHDAPSHGYKTSFLVRISSTAFTIFPILRIPPCLFQTIISRKPVMDTTTTSQLPDPSGAGDKKPLTVEDLHEFTAHLAKTSQLATSIANKVHETLRTLEPYDENSVHRNRLIYLSSEAEKFGHKTSCVRTKVLSEEITMRLVERAVSNHDLRTLLAEEINGFSRQMHEFHNSNITANELLVHRQQLVELLDKEQKLHKDRLLQPEYAILRGDDTSEDVLLKETLNLPHVRARYSKLVEDLDSRFADSRKALELR